jgi:hypothetical protein
LNTYLLLKKINENINNRFLNKMEKNKTVSKRLLRGGIVILLLTIIHHIYGGIIYNTPVRFHIAWFALPAIGVMILLYTLHVREKSSPTLSKIALWLFLAITILIPIGTFGLAEGGYNHLLKNILYFGGASEELMTNFYPDPIIEMPNDFWFEFTGVLQFFVGGFVFNTLLRYRKEQSG